MGSKKSYQDYQPELDDIIQTLKRIKLKLDQTQPYLNDFRKLIKKFKSPVVTLSNYPDVQISITHPIGHSNIRRELQKDHSIKVYLDIDQYILCQDEVLAEYLDYYLHTFGKKLTGMTPQEIKEQIEIPQNRSTVVKIVGEKIILQLRERDLLQAQNELFNRLDEIIFDVYGMKPRDTK